MTEAIEQWLPFPGYTGIYEVSDNGRVRSLDRSVRGRNGLPRAIRGKLLTPCVGGGGYLQVSLRRPLDGLRSVVVHRAVLLAFNGAPVDGQEACHGPAGRLVNELANLRWDTRAANVADKKAFGRTVEGEKNGNAVLTESAVAEIRASSESRRVLAERYSVSTGLIGHIRAGRSWKHLLHTPKSWGYAPC